MFPTLFILLSHFLLLDLLYLVSSANSGLFLLLDLLHLVSLEESDSLYDESVNDGSDSGSSGMGALSFSFENSVGCISGMGSGAFFQIGSETN